MGFKMDAPDPGLLRVGTHLMEIYSAKEKYSKKSGALMWEIKLRAVDDPQKTVEDWWMCEGKMAWAMRKRLTLLGFPKDGEVECSDVIGKRFYAAIKHEDGRDGMVARIDNRAEDSTVGMWPEEAPPHEIGLENAMGSNLFGEKDPPPPPVDPNAPPF